MPCGCCFMPDFCCQNQHKAYIARLSGGLANLQAAAALAALALGEPAAACELLVQQLDGLKASAGKLADLSAPEAGAAAPADKQLQVR